MSPLDLTLLIDRLRTPGGWPVNDETAREIIGKEIARIEAAKDETVRAMLADPVALRANILRYGPAGFDLYSAEYIERIKSEAVHQVEQKLNDALAENNKLWATVKHDSVRMQAMMTQLAAVGITPSP